MRLVLTNTQAHRHMVSRSCALHTDQRGPARQFPEYLEMYDWYPENIQRADAIRSVSELSHC